MTCYVYWIKRKSFTNPNTQGYIGISNNPQNRFNQHKSSKQKVGNAIRKYRDIEFIILHETTRKEALELEKKYRPSDYIGWNVISGGSEPPRNHLSEDVRNRISDTLKTKNANPYSEKTHSPETIAKREEAKRKNKPKWFYNPGTGESKLFKTAFESPPEFWIPGKKTKKKPKIRGVDYECHTSNWHIIDPQGNEFEVFNLKKWCKENGLKYQTVYGSAKGWKTEQR
jgi:predicted GIY-YIG superfamily endonuclease